MLVLIHWVGEETALGARNVIRQPGGGTLLTNPRGDGKVGGPDLGGRRSQIMAGGYLFWRAAKLLWASPVVESRCGAVG